MSESARRGLSFMPLACGEVGGKERGSSLRKVGEGLRVRLVLRGELRMRARSCTSPSSSPLLMRSMSVTRRISGMACCGRVWLSQHLQGREKVARSADARDRCSVCWTSCYSAAFTMTISADAVRPAAANKSSIHLFQKVARHRRMMRTALSNLLCTGSSRIISTVLVCSVVAISATVEGRTG